MPPLFVCSANPVIGNGLAIAIVNGAGYSPTFVFGIDVLIAVLGFGAFFAVHDISSLTAVTAATGHAASAAVTESAAATALHAIASMPRLACSRDFGPLVPVCVFLGFSKGFVFATYTQLVGQYWVGPCLLAYGITTVVGSGVFGRAADVLGRRSATGTAFALAVTTFGMCGVAEGSVTAPWAPALFVAAAAVFGLADGGINTLTYATIGARFEAASEAAYAAEKCLETIGAGSYFLVATFMSYSGNLSLVAGVLVASILGWVAYQVRGFDRAPRTAVAAAAQQGAGVAGSGAGGAGAAAAAAGAAISGSGAAEAAAPAAGAAAAVGTHSVSVSIAVTPTAATTPVAPVRGGWIELT